MPIAIARNVGANIKGIFCFFGRRHDNSNILKIPKSDFEENIFSGDILNYYYEKGKFWGKSIVGENHYLRIELNLKLVFMHKTIFFRKWYEKLDEHKIMNLD